MTSVKVLRRDLIMGSLVTCFIILVLGTYDMEEVYHFQYSAGSSFGGWLNKHSGDTSLVKTLFGIPVYDLGITGGYRLPFQGTLNTSLFWPVGKLVSLELYLSLHLFVALVVGALAFSNFVSTWLPDGVRISIGSRLVAMLAWVALSYPIFEYLLLEDWYSCAVPYLGFLTLVTGVLAQPIISSKPADIHGLRRALWFTVGGIYLMFLGHFSMVVMYAPYVLISLLPLMVQLVRVRKRLKELLREVWIPTIALSLVVLRIAVVILDLSPEFLARSEIADVGDWWASPTRSTSDLKHFLGQLFAVEFAPWLKYLSPDLLARFNVSANSLSRLPVSGVLPITALFLSIFLAKLDAKPKSIVAILLAMWLTVFAIMIDLLPAPTRASAQYLYRDVLLLIAVLAVAITHFCRSERKRSRRSQVLHAVIIVALFIGPAVASATRPVFRVEQNGWRNPYAPLRQMFMKASWHDEIIGLTSTERGTIGVVDPVFLRRYADGSMAPNERDWRGLRGYHQLRQFGFQSIEGFAKVRDASAFTGQANQFQQRIGNLTVEHCTQELLTFLNIDLLLMSAGETTETCTRQFRLSSSALGATLRFPEPRQLADSGMSWIRLRNTGVLVLGNEAIDSAPVKCGILATSDCLKVLGTELSEAWRINKSDCGNRCLLTLERREPALDDSQVQVLLPINSRNGIRFFSAENQELRQSTLNGLVVVDLRDSSTRLVRAELHPDLRMWLQVVAGWSQFLLLIVLLWRRRGLVNSKVRRGGLNLSFKDAELKEPTRVR